MITASLLKKSVQENGRLILCIAIAYILAVPQQKGSAWKSFHHAARGNDAGMCPLT